MKILDIYKSFNKEMKVNFWVVTTNVILVVFTAWLGFVIQDIIVSKNTKIQTNILQFENAEKFYPAYESIYINHGNILNQLGSELLNDKIPVEDKLNRHKAWINSHSSEILSMADSTLKTFGKLRFYVSPKYDEEIRKNNIVVLLCSKIISELDSVEANPNYKINKNLISQIKSSNQFFLACGFNSVIGEDADKLWNELVSTINFSDASSINNCKYLSYSYMLEAMLKNLLLFEKIRNPESVNNGFIEYIKVPFALLIFTFIAIIIILQIVIRFMAPKRLDKTYSSEEYKKLEKEKDNVTNTIKVRELTIYRLEQIIKEKEKIIKDLNDKITESES